MPVVSYVEAVARHAEQRPDEHAIVFVTATGAEQAVSWHELDAWSSRLARVLVQRGLGPGGLLTVALANAPIHTALTLAAWKAGAAVLPLSARMPVGERRRILDVAARRWRIVQVARAPVSGHDHVPISELEPARPGASTPLAAPDLAVADLPDPGIVVTSGGSTGQPKLIVNAGKPVEPVAVDGRVAGLGGALGMRPGQVQLVACPLFHGGPVSWSLRGLCHGHTLVLMERFDAGQALGLMERHRVSWAFLVPTMLRRMAAHDRFHQVDLSAVDAVWTASAPCPPEVIRAWIGRLGPERFMQAYGGSEAAGHTVVTGAEWLARPGTVGRPVPRWQVSIRDPDGHGLPVGEVGRIYFRRTDGSPALFDYVGSDVDRLAGSWVGLGDLGHVDGDGYLYIADRRTDLIISGGANIYPSEVEHVLLGHPRVRDAVVVGIPDPDLGKRAHALVVATGVTVVELREHCERQLASYKVPRSFELADQLPRDEFGKIRRSGVAAAYAPNAGSRS
ncbi:MAG TPA: AMP-binding protein [Nitriliruptorales bacterium]